MYVQYSTCHIQVCQHSLHCTCCQCKQLHLIPVPISEVHTNCRAVPKWSILQKSINKNNQTELSTQAEKMYKPWAWTLPSCIGNCLSLANHILKSASLCTCYLPFSSIVLCQNGDHSLQWSQNSPMYHHGSFLLSTLFTTEKKANSCNLLHFLFVFWPCLFSDTKKVLAPNCLECLVI